MSSAHGRSTLQQPQTIIPEQVRNEAGVIFPLKFESTGPGDYKVTLLNSNSHEEASTTFHWELTTRAAEMSQLEQVRSAMREGKADAQSINALAAFGRRLYGFVFNGKVAEELLRARTSAERVYIHLYLHPDLDAAPWEYMCEPQTIGEPRFLLLDRKISISRGNNPAAHAHAQDQLPNLPDLDRPLRMLVIVSSPPDLPESQKLDTLRELRLLRRAVAPLVERGELELHELDEPSQPNISLEMQWRPHIVHFTGHGNFDPHEGGVVLIEDGANHMRQVTASDFAAMIGGGGARLVVLSACRSAESSAADNRTARPGVGARLLAGGMPAIVAMQESVRDDHAAAWAGQFYSSLVGGWSVAQAMEDARLHLKLLPASDWGLPVLLTEHPNQALFRFKEGSPPALPPQRGVDSILLNNPGDLFVGRQLEQRRLVKGLLGDSMRIGIIIGPGGIGKSSLAHRLYERTLGRFWAALSVDCTPQPSGEQILAAIDEWLRSNGDDSLSAVLQNEKLSLEQKLPYIVGAIEREDSPYLGLCQSRS